MKGHKGSVVSRKKQSETLRKKYKEHPELFQSFINQQQHLSKFRSDNKGENNPMFGKKSWNHGLTKKDHPAIMNQSKSMKKNWANENSIYRSPEYQKKHALWTKSSASGKASWNAKTEKEKEEWSKKMLEAQERRPTRPEVKFIEIINKYNLPYKYVGDGSFWINKINPDFVNINKEKKIIEIFGDYWHNLNKNKLEDDRKLKILNEYGWKRIVIWEHELNDLTESEIIQKV